MKKLVFAAVAAFVMVSVGNVFAVSSQSGLGTILPSDTTSTDSVAPVEQTVGQPAETPADTTATSTEGSDDTALLMMSDSVTTDTTSTTSADVA